MLPRRPGSSFALNTIGAEHAPSAPPEEIERQVNIGEALELRIGGANYRQIANVLKVSVGTAHTYVNEGLEQLRQANAEAFEELRLLEVARLDSMMVALWSKRGNPRTADTILRVSERRARLLGLDVGTVGNDPLPYSVPHSTLPTTISVILVAPDRTPVSPLAAGQAEPS